MAHESSKRTRTSTTKYREILTGDTSMSGCSSYGFDTTRYKYTKPGTSSRKNIVFDIPTNISQLDAMIEKMG